MKRILVTGADGKIGRALAARLEARGLGVHKTWYARSRPPRGHLPLDLASEASGWPLPPGLDTAYLMAAVTSLAECEGHPEKTRAVNVFGTLALARRLARQNAFVVFPSTNLVFDGQTPAESPSATRLPRCAYGAQKVEAERALMDMAGPGAAVIRFTKVLGPGNPLLEMWARDLMAGKTVHPFEDMVFAPVSLDFALEILEKVGLARLPGVWQVSATRDITYADAALRIAARMGVRLDRVKPVAGVRHRIRPAHLPRYTSLNAERAARELGMPAPDPFEAVDILLARFLRDQDRSESWRQTL